MWLIPIIWYHILITNSIPSLFLFFYLHRKDWYYRSYPVLWFWRWSMTWQMWRMNTSNISFTEFISTATRMSGERRPLWLQLSFFTMWKCTRALRFYIMQTSLNPTSVAVGIDKHQILYIHKWSNLCCWPQLGTIVLFVRGRCLFRCCGQGYNSAMGDCENAQTSSQIIWMRDCSISLLSKELMRCGEFVVNVLPYKQPRWLNQDNGKHVTTCYIFL